MMARRAWNLAWLALCWSLSAAADPGPQQLVEQTTNSVLEELRANRDRLNDDSQFVKRVVEEKIVPHLDFETMTALAVYSNWREATAEQRAALIREFSALLLRTYGKSLTEFRDQRIEFLPFAPQERKNLAVVRTRFHPTSGTPVPVDYRLRYKNEWKIFDIAIDGISLVTNYRSSFAAEIAKSGIDGLIESLKRKNEGSGQQQP